MRGKTAGLGLRFLATAGYITVAMGIILVVLEVGKGIQIHPYIQDPLVSYGGAIEVGALTVLAFLAARLIDRASKKIYPRLDRARGWGELVE
ncbi:MAG: hypothetical protein OXH94_02305 [Rhodospirillales bacterium]|nr:hypothetical protein [Rhodospirillales bacterium]